MNLINLYRT